MLNHKEAVPDNRKRFVYRFAGLFFGYYLLTLLFQWGEKHLNYPFSTMGFYSETRAVKPYTDHHYWPIYTGRIDAYPTGAEEPVDLAYRETHLEDMLFRDIDIQSIREIEQSYLVRAKKGLYLKAPAGGATSYVYEPVEPERLYFRAGLMAVTPYPQPLEFVDMHMALRAVRDEQGFRAAFGQLLWDEERQEYMIEWQLQGFKQPELSMLTRYNIKQEPRIEEPVELPGEWLGHKFAIRSNDQDPRLIYSLLQVTDKELGITETYYGPDGFRSYRTRR